MIICFSQSPENAHLLSYLQSPFIIWLHFLICYNLGTLTPKDAPGHFEQQLFFFGIPGPKVDYNVIYIDDDAAIGKFLSITQKLYSKIDLAKSKDRLRKMSLFGPIDKISALARGNFLFRQKAALKTIWIF